MESYDEYVWNNQKQCIISTSNNGKCLINMWCGTGKTRTFTINLFINNKNLNVIVFPSLGLINQYCNDYVLSSDEPFKTDFKKYECLAFCSDDGKKLKNNDVGIEFTTNEDSLGDFLKQKDNKIILVTYHSFEKFVNVCINKKFNIGYLIYDEAHHIVGDAIQNVAFSNPELDSITDITQFYTATPVNKNGITMYDRDDPENSDCGVLAYEYLYYKAVEDGICKSFETQIMLYTQKPEYTNKYQPVFESIIRACLSGKYNYWNVLTYHSFVNENEDMSDNISFVKKFASGKNQKLVKQLFTRIQNEEFADTKDTYSVENVILKGVHSDTKQRHTIIEDFDEKKKGRINILASCGILNEGIDTKWANMGVPINPSNSIVKESQRIGRLVRIPEKGMPPAIMLIPCEVNITKYASMDTPEQRDQMIREELSECGNFNTALNVISAFKYQYDPEMFELCLKYPNMYAPKEVKNNLETQGLIVKDSEGDLLDNLKYVCEKEGIELDTESFEQNNDTDTLNDIAEQCGKTIEIHTQNHEEPVKYINEDATDDQPLRLFYCEDDKTYSPIVKKNKKKKIKKKSTTAPKKRPKLFDVHQHPDLEVLWKIKEGSIDLNKTFSQGVLDVNINWNEKKWNTKLTELKSFIDTNDKTPKEKSTNSDEKQLGYWIGTQKKNYQKNTYIMKNTDIYDKWTQFVTDYSKYIGSPDELWNTKLTELKSFIDTNDKTPSPTSTNSDEKQLSSWSSHQRENYQKKTYIMKNTDIYDKWTQFVAGYSKYFKTRTPKPKKDMSKPKIKPKKTDKEIKEERQQRTQSELSQLHQKYKTMTSQNLNTEFKEYPEKWKEYHKISKDNEESFPEEEIPRNKMIKYLENLPGKKQKIIADLGCGFADINQHFKDNSRFKFHNFDHHSANELVVSRDIKNTKLEDYSVDISILSLAMWGSNCSDYITEAYRILDTGGTLLIGEPFKRWNKELDEQDKPINKLVTMLEENNLTIIKTDVGKFMFIECRKT